MELSAGAYNNAKDASAAWTLRLVADTAECALVSTKFKSITGYQTTVKVELFAFDLAVFIPPTVKQIVYVRLLICRSLSLI